MLGYCRVLNKSCPRNQQDPTVASIGSGGFVLLGKCQDLSQCTDEDDVGPAAFCAHMNLDVVDHGPDNVQGLGTGGLVGQGY